MNLCVHLEDFEVHAVWNFFAMSYGKAPCDGVEGTVKWLAPKASLQRPLRDKILLSYELFLWAKEGAA